MTDSSPRSSSVGILEDDEGLRVYLEGVISETEGFRIAFSTGLVAEAIEACARTGPDLCLVDLKLPDGSGLDFINAIKPLSAAKCLILTALGDRSSVLIALRAGADGYLLKDTPPDLLRTSMLRTLRGETPISPQAATYLLDIWKATAGPPTVVPSERALTEREAEVLRLFSRGLNYQETAHALGISSHTIRDHVKAIYRKLDVHSRTEALFEARHLGLISLFD